MPQWQTVREGWARARAEQKPLLVYVSLPDCRYCRRLEQDTLADQRVNELLRDSFVMSRADGQRDAELIRQWEIGIFPTLLIISPKNKGLVYIRGYLSADQLAAQLSIYKQGHTAAGGAKAVRETR